MSDEPYAAVFDAFAEALRITDADLEGLEDPAGEEQIAGAEAALDIKITEILRVVAEIQTHSKPVIENCYRDFLLQNHDPDEREYADAADQLREVLIHGNYLSQKDIEICLGFDVDTLAAGPGIDGMRELQAALTETYKTED